MDEKQFKLLRKDMQDIKNLLALFLKNFKIENKSISKILNITPGRLSQMAPKKKYSKKQNDKRKRKASGTS